jgi:hypothetical protein
VAIAARIVPLLQQLGLTPRGRQLLPAQEQADDADVAAFIKLIQGGRAQK